jgi:release factor glutamine methyltransferase
MSVRADPEALVDSRPTVRAALELGAAALREAGIEGGRTDAEWLLAEVLGVSRGRLGLHLQHALQAPDAARYVRALRRRITREPLQHIVGTQAFRDLTLRVSGDALVPRPETELLAGWALELLPTRSGPLAIDLGTGSGCIACALDVSPCAVALARANVAGLGLTERVRVEVSDLFSALGAVRAALIVSNPPYLPSGLIASLAPEVRQHDPRLALDGGPDGLDVIRRILEAAPSWLEAGGRLLLETAGGAQVADVVALMSARGFVAIETRRDLAGVARFVAGEAS